MREVCLSCCCVRIPDKMVKLILRKEEYEVKPGMTLRHALEKIGVNPEGVIATRDSELITDDEILQENDVIRLVAAISGG